MSNHLLCLPRGAPLVLDLFEPGILSYEMSTSSQVHFFFVTVEASHLFRWMNLLIASGNLAKKVSKVNFN